MPIEPEYLGDGVYASHDGDMVKLDLRGSRPSPRKGYDSTVEIFLEPEAFQKLMEYGQRAFTMPEKVLAPKLYAAVQMAERELRGFSPFLVDRAGPELQCVLASLQVILKAAG